MKLIFKQQPLPDRCHHGRCPLFRRTRQEIYGKKNLIKQSQYLTTTAFYQKLDGKQSIA